MRCFYAMNSGLGIWIWPRVCECVFEPCGVTVEWGGWGMMWELELV